jgi:hypothetical protein
MSARCLCILAKDCMDKESGYKELATLSSHISSVVRLALLIDSHTLVMTAETCALSTTPSYLDPRFRYADACSIPLMRPSQLVFAYIYTTIQIASTQSMSSQPAAFSILPSRYHYFLREQACHTSEELSYHALRRRAHTHTVRLMQWNVGETAHTSVCPERFWRIEDKCV